MSTSTEKRLRALRIREAALGFADDVSGTLIGMAEDLEGEASALEAQQEAHLSEPVEKPQSS